MPQFKFRPVSYFPRDGSFGDGEGEAPSCAAATSGRSLAASSALEGSTGGAFEQETQTQDTVRSATQILIERMGVFRAFQRRRKPHGSKVPAATFNLLSVSCLFIRPGCRFKIGRLEYDRSHRRLHS